MPSNKNRLLQKQIERTGKNQIVVHSVGICPEYVKDVLVFKILKIGFTVSGECVTIEEVARAKNEADAFVKLQVEMVNSGALDLTHLRKLVKEVKKEYNEKKAAE